MAANVAVTYNFTAGTPAVADNVDQNFADVVNWINTNAVHLDGSKAFTSIPSGPATDPTSANQLARKAYVDATADPRKGGTWLRQATTMSFPSGATTTVVFDTESADTDGFGTATSSFLTVPAGAAGVYVVYAQLYGSSVALANSNIRPMLVVNGSDEREMPAGSYGSSGGSGIQASTTIPFALAVGNTLRINVFNNTGSTFTAKANLTLYRISL